MNENNTRTIGDTIRLLREERGLTQQDLSDELKISRSAIGMYESGERVPNDDAKEVICDYFNIDMNYLYGKTEIRNSYREQYKKIGDYLTPISIKFDDYFPLHYCTNLSCGSFDELLDSEPDSVVYVPIKYQHMKDRLYAFKVNGTSMNNVIEDESIVITESVGHLSSINPGTIVVALLNGEATVKRLFVNEKTVTLMPDSSDKAFQPIMIDLESEKVEIVGRVIWHMNPDNISDRY